MSATEVLINLLATGEGGELASSQQALRLLMGLDYGVEVQTWCLFEPFAGATPFDCIMMLLERCNSNGVKSVVILTDICEVAWMSLWIEVGRAWPSITLRRLHPDDFAGTMYVYW